MTTRWRPNADAGCVRMHRNPCTRRRPDYNESIPERYRRDDRRAVKVALRIYAVELAYGDLTLSMPKVRRGWDPGDKLGASTRDYILA